jgi:hypothetical protein
VSAPRSAPQQLSPTAWGWCCIAGTVVGLGIGKVIDLAIGGPGLLRAFGILP